MVIRATSSQGVKDVLVDDADADLVTPYRWHVQSQGYAVGRVEGRLVLMHRHILQPPKGMVVDHRNHNKLDDRRSNIWVCTQRVNAANRMEHVSILERKRHKNSKTGFTGVHPHRNGRFRVTIRGRSRGAYDTAEEAAAARLRILKDETEQL